MAQRLFTYSVYTPPPETNGRWNVQKQYTVSQHFRASFDSQTQNENAIRSAYAGLFNNLQFITYNLW